MENPFKADEEKGKHEFFKQMTEAINDWMLTQYPEFDNQLIGKMKFIEISQTRLDNDIKTHRQYLVTQKEEFISMCIREMHEFLEKEYPDLDGNLKQVAKTLKRSSVEIEKKLKTFKVYESLCEDVYKMRDEFTKIKTLMETFQQKVKKAFDI